MTTSRQKILTHLKKTRSASAREIARALKLSAPNVRHHLSVLCSDGRVEMTSIHNREGKGRPEKVYSLSKAMLGDNLSVLLAAVLDVAGRKVDMNAVAKLILDDSQFARLPINKQLPMLIEKMNAMHYQARWEAGAGGPRVLFGRCPYAQIINGHPEICSMDQRLVETGIGKNVSMIRKNESPVTGFCPFIFQVE